MEKNDQEYFDKLYEQSEADMEADAEEWLKDFPDRKAVQQHIDNTPNRPAEWWREETQRINNGQNE